MPLARALALFCICVVPVYADGITVTGAITQSTPDGTGPAVNNTSLNNINDGDTYTVTLSFTGSIHTPGTFNLATDLSGATMVLADAAASSTETAFDNPNSTLQITQSGGVDTFNWLGCLTTGSGCMLGNQLDLIFTIPSPDLNSQNVAAGAVFGQKQFELLEDDGITDLQGTISTYSYVVTPEPGTIMLLASSLVGLAAMRRRFRK